MKISTTFLFVIFFINSFSQQGAAPQIHGADIYGARADRPFLYKIPATGTVPVSFEIINLPEGLKLDGNTGIITGSVSEEGNYKTAFIAKNNYGADTLNFEIKIGNEISLTPAMAGTAGMFLGCVLRTKILETLQMLW